MSAVTAIVGCRVLFVWTSLAGSIGPVGEHVAVTQGTLDGNASVATVVVILASRAIFLVGKVGRFSDHPDMAWPFARENMKALLAKVDALGANSYAPGLFGFFSDLKRVDELKAYARANLPEASGKEVAKAIDEIQIRAELKDRLARQFTAWGESRKKS